MIRGQSKMAFAISLSVFIGVIAGYHFLIHLW